MGEYDERNAREHEAQKVKDHDMLIRIDENVKAIKDSLVVLNGDVSSHETRIQRIEDCYKTSGSIYWKLATGVMAIANVVILYIAWRYKI